MVSVDFPLVIRLHGRFKSPTSLRLVGFSLDELMIVFVVDFVHDCAFGCVGAGLVFGYTPLGRRKIVFIDETSPSTSFLNLLRVC